MSDKITIAVDAMGGDNSPEKVIKGISLHSSRAKNIVYNIFGNKNLINPLLNLNKINNEYKIIHTDQQITNEDSALGAAKKGRTTSMWLAIDSVKKMESDIVVSAGNTGALFVIAKLNLDMIENIDKPALSGLWPSKKGMSVVLDLGANIDCSEKNFIQFSKIGSQLFSVLFSVTKPKVGLLNIGSEEIKGNETLKSTNSELTKKIFTFNYIGYVEGSDITKGIVDVVVTDGFTGNIALKTAEGTAKLYQSHLNSAYQSSFISKFGYLLSSIALKSVKERLDPRVHNCGIFMGLNALVVKCHGQSEFKGISYASDIIYSLLENDVNEKIKKYMIETHSEIAIK